jgi:hypothetical protein
MQNPRRECRNRADAADVPRDLTAYTIGCLEDHSQTPVLDGNRRRVIATRNSHAVDRAVHRTVAFLPVINFFWSLAKAIKACHSIFRAA